MNPPLSMDIFLQIDFPALAAACLTCACCALVGSFLVLRRQALMGDALSHVVLPGIVGGFLVAGTIATVPMLAGALLACLWAVLWIEIIRRFGNIESGATMGVVFTSMFAAGLVLLEQRIGTRVHLDAQHALYGSLEMIYWPEPGDWSALPRQIGMLGVLLVVLIIFVTLFYKELKITTFDPLLASFQGFHSGWMNAALMLMTALTVVAAFEAVGSILVIAMLICPAAAARMLTDRLSCQLWLSVLIGVLAAITGYAVAAWLSPALGIGKSLNAAGMIAVMAGLFQLIAMLYAPRHGALRAGAKNRKGMTGD